MLNIYNSQNPEQSNGKTASNGNGVPPLPPPTVSKNGLKQYQDPTGEFNSNELTWSLWYLKHKVLLYRILVGVLIGISVILWGYSLIQWLIYAIVGIPQDQALQQSLSRTLNYTVIQPHFAPAPLQILDVKILPGGVNKTDAVAEIYNPNLQQLAEFNYYFVSGDLKSDSKHVALMPGESRLIGALGLSEDFGGGVNIMVENLTWTRLSKHEFPDPATYEAERINFGVSDFTFTRAVADGPGAHAITFKFTNQSAFGYVNADFLVALYSGGDLVSVLPLQLKDFKSLETRDIDLRSFVTNLNVSEVKVYPALNVFDSSVFLAPEK
jgi:hypothetical protein